MHFLLISHPSPGLIHDQRVVKSSLLTLGHSVSLINPSLSLAQQRTPLPLPEDLVRSSVVIFFEHLFILNVPALKVLFYVNPEWLSQGEVELIRAGSLVDIILVKSRDALGRFSSYFPAVETVYTGFRSSVQFDMAIKPNYNLCLHVRGYASQKGSDQVIRAYTDNTASRLPVCLMTMRCFDAAVPNFAAWITPRLRLFFYDINHHILETLSRKRGIHLCPSTSEGFGHYIFESMAHSALIIASNIPPINELLSSESAILLDFPTVNYDLHQSAVPDSHMIVEALEHVSSMSLDERARYGTSARNRAKVLSEEFESTFALFIHYLCASLPMI